MKISMLEGDAIAWQEAIGRHQSALGEELRSLADKVLDELRLRLDSEKREALAQAVATGHSQAVAQAERARDQARQATADSLNQTLRLLRQAAAPAPLLGLLASGAAAWCDHAVVLSVENGQARSLSGEISFGLNEAGAIAGVVEGRDPMIALASERELSASLASAFPDAGEEAAPAKVYLFPVLVRQETVAVLAAAGNVFGPPLELLCEVAGMKLETLEPRPAEALLPLPPSPAGGNGLVHIAIAPIPATTGPRVWDDLSAEDQRLHLQAQRVARVRVAEMRLYHANAFKGGAFAGDIYRALRSEIDQARADFLQTFLSQSPTMVDYLHLEILRSLAHDDDRILGEDYPGPMV